MHDAVRDGTWKRLLLTAVGMLLLIGVPTMARTQTVSCLQQQVPGCVGVTAPGSPSTNAAGMSPLASSYFPPCASVVCVGGGGTLTNSGVVAGVLTTNPSASFGPLDAPGATAFGNTSWAYFPCATLACDGTGATLSSGQVGGAGYQSAFTAFVGQAPGSDGGPFQQYLASATLQGELSLPLLKAIALAQEVTGTAPGFSSECCFYYNSQAAATTLQWYSFLGTTAETFTLAFAIDAVLLAYHDLAVDYRPNASVAGGLFLFDGMTTPELALELPLGSSIAGTQMILDGSMANASGAVSRTASVTFTLQPGSGFYLRSYLSANAPQLPGFFVSDASHTFTSNFTAGNTSLLTAQLPGVPAAQAPPVNTTVPEPATYLLMAVGLAAIAAAQRTSVARHA